MADSSQPTVFALHTSFVLVDVLKPLFAEHLPNARIVNVVDDSLLADVRAAGHMIPSVAQRLVGYGMLAQAAGATAIFSTCSSVGEVASTMRQVLHIPVVKIDDCMADEALTYGDTIAVVATVPTTLDPTARLIEGKAGERGISISIGRFLVAGAFDALMAGDAQRHDQLVLDAIERAAHEADAVVLAQGSMARLIGQLPSLPVPVLSSPTRGVEDLKRVLAQQTALV